MRVQKFLSTFATVILSSFLGGFAAVSLFGVDAADAQAGRADMERLSVRTLRILDVTGATRASLTVGDRGPVLTMMDPGGVPRLSFNVGDGGPEIRLRDDSGHTRILIVKDDAGGASIRLQDREGRLRAVIGSNTVINSNTGEVMATPESSLSLSDETGTIVWKAP